MLYEFTEHEGWGAGSVGNVPRTHVQKPGVEAHTCNPSTLGGGGQEQEDPWNSLANQLSGITELLSPVKDPISKTEQRKGLGGVEGGEAAIGM